MQKAASIDWLIVVKNMSTFIELIDWMIDWLAEEQ